MWHGSMAHLKKNSQHPINAQSYKIRAYVLSELRAEMVASKIAVQLLKLQHSLSETHSIFWKKISVSAVGLPSPVHVKLNNLIIDK